MITVFRVACCDGYWPSKPYQGINLDSRVFQTEAERFDYNAKYHCFEGVPKNDWNPAPIEPTGYLGKPLRLPSTKKLPEPDVWGIYDGAFAVWTEFLKKNPELERILTRAGQLLMQPFKDKELTICNILVCVNCIDEERTLYHGPLKVVQCPFFVPTELPESKLFKIPQSPTKIFAWEDSDSIDPQNDFKAWVEKRKLTNIYFLPAWSETEGIIRQK